MRLLARRWLLILLMLVTTGAQTLALVHAVAHVPGGAAHAQGAGDAAHSTLPSLFSLDEDGVACQLLDQLAHCGTPAAAAVAVAHLAADAVVAALITQLATAAPAAFLARGPPTLTR